MSDFILFQLPNFFRKQQIHLKLQIVEEFFRKFFKIEFLIKFIIKIKIKKNAQRLSYQQTQ